MTYLHRLPVDLRTELVLLLISERPFEWKCALNMIRSWPELFNYPEYHRIWKQLCRRDLFSEDTCRASRGLARRRRPAAIYVIGREAVDDFMSTPQHQGIIGYDVALRKLYSTATPKHLNHIAVEAMLCKRRDIIRDVAKYLPDDQIDHSLFDSKHRRRIRMARVGK